MKLEDLRGTIFSYISKKKKNVKTKLKINNSIFDTLYNEERIFKSLNEKDEYVPYILLDDGEAVEIDINRPQIQSVLTCNLGLDSNHNSFGKELIHFLKYQTIQSGKIKQLEKFSIYKNDTLYVSSGKRNFICVRYRNDIVFDVFLEKCKNGTDDVIFDSNYCLAEWDIVEQNDNIFNGTQKDPQPHIDDINLKSFDINTYIPDGINVYNSIMQKDALITWLIAALLRVKPLPILLFYGNKSSGKTLTSKAIMKLFLGENGNVSIFPNNKRSMMSCITESFLYTIDNLDSKVPPWFSDTLTLCSTGGTISERALFTNSDTFRKEISSSVIITTRNGNFAKREDIKDRILPVFFDNRTDYSYSEENLLGEVIQNRNKILSELTMAAFASKRCSLNIEFKENYRFTTVGKFFKNRIEMLDRDYNIQNIISSIKNAQFSSLTDVDPLVQYILDFDYSKTEHGYLEGTPLQIIKLLHDHNNDIDCKPRVFSRKIKENMDVFVINNWDVTFEKLGHSTKFKIVPPTR